MEVRTVAIGQGPSRCHVALLAVLIPVFATIGFLLQVDTHLPTGMFLFGVLVLGSSVALAGYAGWSGGGLVPGAGAVYLAVLWLFLVPPYIAYLQGLEFPDPRYTIPRLAVYGTDAQTEWAMAVEQGPVFATGAAVGLGCSAYFIGSLYSADPPTWAERWISG